MMRFALPALLLAPLAARAADIPCGAVEPDVIHVDGLLDDWSDVAGIDIGGRDRDRSFTAKCNYDAKTLYLAVDVRDNYLVRTRDARATEDHLVIAFAEGDKVEKLIIYPADAEAKAPHKVAWSTGRKLRGVEVAESKQPQGWSVELRIALASVPGWGPGAALIHLGVGFTDVDSKSHPKVEGTLESSPLGSAKMLGTVEFGEGKQALEAFLRDRKLTTRDVLFDRPGRVTPQGSVRVVVAGPYVATIGEEYSYLKLPVGDPRKEIRDVRLVDLAGDGRESLVLRYTERGGGGSREVLGAFRMTGDGLRRTFGCEVSKAMGANRLETRVSFAKKGRATEVVVEALPAVGWTEATYRESAADDVVPIPTPWATPKRARFQFRGDEYVRAE
jgi:hypothetical protein